MELRKIILLISFCGFLFACSEENPTTNNRPINRGTNITVLNDEIKGEPVMIYINNATETMVAFSRKTSQGVLEFSNEEISSNSTFVDNLGNRWNIFGEGLSAENQGEKLTAMNYLYGYWFVFPAFFDSVQVHNSDLLTFPPKICDNEDWLVPTNGIVSTGGRDLLPSIDEPEYLNADEIIRSNPEDVQYPDLNSLATVIKIDNDIFIYPHKILNYHEIVNDNRNGVSFTLSFCPLTQTSQLWLRDQFEENTFGVSGLLYNSNLILYDRSTESYWSQVMQKSIHGELVGERINVTRVIEMTLRSALQLDGNKHALSLNTGFNRDYDVDFYEQYKNAANAIYHPVIRTGNALPSKEKVLGIITNNQYVKVYTYQ